MMGRRDQERLFYEFRLEDRIPQKHLLRRMNVFVTVALADLHKRLEAHYSDIGRPSIDPELMVRMLIVGYCYGIRSERKLCQEVKCRGGGHADSSTRSNRLCSEIHSEWPFVPKAGVSIWGKVREQVDHLAGAQEPKVRPLCHNCDEEAAGIFIPAVS